MRAAGHHHVGDVDIFPIDQIAHVRISPHPMLGGQISRRVFIHIANRDQVKHIFHRRDHGQMRPRASASGTHECNFETVHNALQKNNLLAKFL